MNQKSLQPDQGWAKPKDRRLGTFFLKYHFFRKNDLFSLCSNIKIFNKNITFFSNEEDMFKDKKCKLCESILKKYNDLDNFSHGEIAEQNYRSYSEW